MTAKDIDRFTATLEHAVAVMAAQAGKPLGGAAHLRDPNGIALLDIAIGQPAPEKTADFRFFAAERTQRLHGNTDHILSWQSMDMDRKLYQGAAKATNGYTAAFSGLPGEDDEALTLWALHQLGWMTATQAQAAAAISDNQRYGELAVAFAQA